MNQGIDCKILIDLIDYHLASRANLGFDSEPLWTTVLNPIRYNTEFSSAYAAISRQTCKELDSYPLPSDYLFRSPTGPVSEFPTGHGSVQNKLRQSNWEIKTVSMFALSLLIPALGSLPPQGLVMTLTSNLEVFLNGFWSNRRSADIPPSESLLVLCLKDEGGKKIWKIQEIMSSRFSCQNNFP